MSTLARLDFWVRGAMGPAVAGASLYICAQPANISTVPSPLVQLYADQAGVTPIAQPMISDGLGHVQCYAPSQLYTLVIVDGGRVQNFYPDQFLSNVSGSATLPPSGSGQYVVTAATDFPTAPANDVVITDGSGSVQDSGVGISSLAPLSALAAYAPLSALAGLAPVANPVFTGGTPWFDIRAYGAVGNNSTDCTAAIQAAINAAAVAGGTVFFPLGTYKVTNWLTIGASNITLLGEKGSVVHINPASVTSTTMFGFTTGVGPSADRAISGSIAAGATSFTATSAGSTSDLTANTWLLIYLKDPNYNDAVNIDFVQVASVTGGTTVNLLNPIDQAFSASGGQTLQFQNMGANGPLVENIIFDGLTIRRDDATLNTGSSDPCALNIYWARNVTVRDCVFELIPGTSPLALAWAVFRSSGVHIINNRVVQKGATSSAGAEVAESTNVVVDGNVFESENVASAQLLVELDFGLNRFSFCNNVALEGTNFGITCQAGIHDGIIANNVLGLVSGQGKGIQLLGSRNVVVANNVLLGPTVNNFAGSVGITVANDTNASPTLVSSKNIVIGNAVGTSNSFATKYNVPNAADTVVDLQSGPITLPGTTTVNGEITAINAAGNQLELQYDSSHLIDFIVESNGDTAIVPNAGSVFFMSYGGASPLVVNPTTVSICQAGGLSTFGGALEIGGATPTGGAGQIGIGNTVGMGNGSSGNVTALAKGTGSGPATPGTVVGWLEIDVAGTKAWVPYCH
jgi:hypothetical protein